MPPSFNSYKLDFSQFHPLDHWPGTPRCWTLYGGPRNHLRMGWKFKWRPELARHTHCRIGRHHMVTAWQRDAGHIRACRNCGKRQRKSVADTGRPSQRREMTDQ